MLSHFILHHIFLLYIVLYLTVSRTDDVYVYDNHRQHRLWYNDSFNDYVPFLRQLIMATELIPPHTIYLLFISSLALLISAGGLGFVIYCQVINRRRDTKVYKAFEKTTRLTILLARAFTLYFTSHFSILYSTLPHCISHWWFLCLW